MTLHDVHPMEVAERDPISPVAWLIPHSRWSGVAPRSTRVPMPAAPRSLACYSVDDVDRLVAALMNEIVALETLRADIRRRAERAERIAAATAVPSEVIGRAALLAQRVVKAVLTSAEHEAERIEGGAQPERHRGDQVLSSTEKSSAVGSEFMSGS